MEARTREEFDLWAEEQHWFLIAEGPSPGGGPQCTWVTPAGDGVISVYDTESKLKGTVKIVPAPPQQPQTMRLPGIQGFGGGLPLGRG